MVFLDETITKLDNLDLNTDSVSKLKTLMLHRLTKQQINEIPVYLIQPGAVVYSLEDKAIVVFNGVNWDNLTPSVVSMPVGSVMMYAHDNIDSEHWKVCDGSELAKADYPQLWTAIGAIWNTANVVNPDLFCLPDLRGMFVRGVNAGRTGNYADPDFERRFNLANAESQTVGSYQAHDLLSHAHTVHMKEEKFDQTEEQKGIAVEGTDGEIIFNTDAKGGAETRPNNVYMHYIIKVKP